MIHNLHTMVQKLKTYINSVCCIEADIDIIEYDEVSFTLKSTIKNFSMLVASWIRYYNCSENSNIILKHISKDEAVKVNIYIKDKVYTYFWYRRGNCEVHRTYNMVLNEHMEAKRKLLGYVIKTI